MNRIKAVTLAMIGAKGFHNLERSGIKNAATRGMAINKGRKVIEISLSFQSFYLRHIKGLVLFIDADDDREQ